MAYQVLYRKYRAKSFDELIGQDKIVETLKNQIKTDSISHAYLFSGSRGTGKTSTAKIFAKAINCPNAINTGEPCFKCEVCRALDEVTNTDILEIDAASNNSVDEIRDIREKVKFLPTVGRYKVYIIDEVHMLTISAFNALLKTLEEPPSHVVFILATTEVHKLPQTILSRCMRFDFNLVPTNVLCNHLKNIFAKENITASDEAIKLIALAGEGSVRDTLSIADCVNAFSAGKITVEKTREVLGTSDNSCFTDLISAVNQKNIAKCFDIINTAYNQGKNMIVFAKNITLTARNLLVAKNCEEGEEISALPEDEKQRLIDISKNITNEDLIEYMKIFSSIEAELKYAISPRTLIETAIVTAISGDFEKKNNF